MLSTNRDHGVLARGPRSSATMAVRSFVNGVLAGGVTQEGKTSG